MNSLNPSAIAWTDELERPGQLARVALSPARQRGRSPVRHSSPGRGARGLVGPKWLRIVAVVVDAAVVAAAVRVVVVAVVVVVVVIVVVVVVSVSGDNLNQARLR